MDELFSRIVPENGLRVGNIDAELNPEKPWEANGRRRNGVAVQWTLQWAQDRKMTSRGHYLAWCYLEPWATGWVLTENEAKRKRSHGLKDDWYADLPKVYAPAGRILWPDEIAACAAWLLADECGPISGQVFDLEQHPFIGRNPPKDASTIPTK